MTYLHRLAHRIARLKIVALIAALGCSEGERADFLSPISSQPFALKLVRIEPRIASTPLGSEFRFAATAIAENGDPISTSFEWSADGGSVSGDGRFVSNTAGPFRVIVRALNRPDKADTAVISVWQNDTDPTGITVEPQSVAMEEGDTLTFRALLNLASGASAAGATVQWSASGGEISGSGHFRAQAAGTYAVTARTSNGYAGSAVVRVNRRTALAARVTIEPRTVRLAPGQGIQFTALTAYTDGKAGSEAYAWRASGGGTLTSSGAFVAGSQEGTFLVVATSQGTPLADTARVTIADRAPTLTSLSASPNVTTVPAGGSQQFLATGTWSDGSTGQPLVNWVATGGSVSSSGVYNAGSVAGTYRVIATHSGSLLSDTASVTVQPPRLVALGIRPKKVTLLPGAAQQFTPTGAWSNGSTAVPPLTWSASGGTMSSTGLFLAGSTPGNYLVVASGGDQVDTAYVSVGAVLQSLTINPRDAQVLTGSQQQFSAVASWSDGSTGPPQLSWSATGGTISPSGVYAAGGVPGTYRVSVSGGGQSDTTVVTLTEAPPSPDPTVTSFSISPKSVSLARGASQQFSASAVWSDGQTRSISISYTATGGTVSVGGLYTAGQVAGAFAVIASCSCGRADTAAVLVLAPSAPTLTSLTLSPRTASVLTGGTQLITASAVWSDGGTALPALTWSATGGSVDGQGSYTAGNTPGTHVVRAQSSTVPSLRDSVIITVSVPSGSLNPPAMPPSPPQALVGESGVTLTVSSVAGADRYRWRGGPNDGGDGAWGPSVASAPQLNIPKPSSGSQWVCVEAGNEVGYSEGRCNSYMVSGTNGENPPPPPAPTPTLVAIELSPSMVTLFPGGSVSFGVIGRMSDNSTTAVSVSYIAQGGTMSGNTYTAGQVEGMFQVTAREAGGLLTAIATITIAPISQPSGASNEPAGFVRYGERSFDAILDPGWLGQHWSARVIQDGTAPKSPSNVVEAVWPAGFSDQQAPPISTGIVTPRPSGIYVSFWFKLSDNWWGHPSATNKILYLVQRDKYPVFLTASGSGSGSLRAVVGLQEMMIGDISPWLNPNRSAGTIQRGRWHHWELLVYANTPGVANGSVRWWLDGQLVGEHSGLGFVAVGFPPGWQGADWTPIWGGNMNATIPAEQTMRLDHMYVSGRP